MKLSDIKKAVAARIKAKYITGYKIYDEEILQSFIKPCFFIELIPISNTNIGKNYDKKRLIVKVHYFPSEDKLAPIYDIQDELGELFRDILPVLNRKLHIVSTEPVIRDFVLYFSFDLDFIDTLIDPNEEIYEYMQTIEIEGV